MVADAGACMTCDNPSFSRALPATSINEGSGRCNCMKTVRDACQLQPNALVIKLSDQIEQLDELITAEGDGSVFFEKTYITQRMRDLIAEGIARLAGASSQAVFHLKQAMGDGRRTCWWASAYSPSTPHCALRTALAWHTRAAFMAPLSPHSMDATTPTTSSGARSPSTHDPTGNAGRSCRLFGQATRCTASQ
jgi:hypothetical protein